MDVTSGWPQVNAPERTSSPRIEMRPFHGTFAFRRESMARRFELGPYDPRGGGGGGPGGRGGNGGPPMPMMYSAHDSLPRRFHHNHNRVPQQQEQHHQRGGQHEWPSMVRLECTLCTDRVTLVVAHLGWVDFFFVRVPLFVEWRIPYCAYTH